MATKKLPATPRVPPEQDPMAGLSNLSAELSGEGFAGEDNGEGVSALPPVNQTVSTPIRAAKLTRAERLAGEKRVKIMLEDNDEIPPTGQFFGLDGRSFMLRPGVEALVPVGLLAILNDAVKSVPVTDPITHQVMEFRNRLRFPYRLLSLPA